MIDCLKLVRSWGWTCVVWGSNVLSFELELELIQNKVLEILAGEYKIIVF